MKCVCKPAARYLLPLTIERVKTDADTDANGIIDMTDDDNWTAFANLRGRAVTNTGREFRNAEQQEAHITHRIMLPFSATTAAITPLMRVRLKQSNAVLNIEAAFDVNQERREIELHCVQRA